MTDIIKSFSRMSKRMFRNKWKQKNNENLTWPFNLNVAIYYTTCGTKAVTKTVVQIWKMENILNWNLKESIAAKSFFYEGGGSRNEACTSQQGGQVKILLGRSCCQPQWCPGGCGAVVGGGWRAGWWRWQMDVKAAGLTLVYEGMSQHPRARLVSITRPVPHSHVLPRNTFHQHIYICLCRPCLIFAKSDKSEFRERCWR